MSTHPIIRYYNASLQPVAAPYMDAYIAQANGQPTLTLFCQRCDLPFATLVIRQLCAGCAGCGEYQATQKTAAG
jgi:hypothetical protein